MPTLAPVFSNSSSSPAASLHSDSARKEGKGKGKAPARPPLNGRVYDETPLPLRPSEKAPQNAHIIDRTDPDDSNDCVATYTVLLGEVEIGDIGIFEILDYVSALELEDYENGRFRVEREVRQAKAIADEEAARQRDLERKARVGRPKGVAGYRIPGEDGPTQHESHEERGGRARPSYKHLYNVTKERRRRKRDPVTGEMIPFSDEEEVGWVGLRDSSPDDVPPVRYASSRPQPLTMDAIPKRRRRKRDPITNELLPLPPLPSEALPSSEPSEGSRPPTKEEKPKRKRRRRHPITNELMPIGWRYDPAKENRSELSSSHRPPVEPTLDSIKRLSLAQEPERKRRKLSSEPSSSGQRSRSPVIEVRPSRSPGPADFAPEVKDGSPGSSMQWTHNRSRDEHGRIQVDVAETLSDSSVDDQRSRRGESRLPLETLKRTSIMHPSAATDNGENMLNNYFSTATKVPEIGPRRQNRYMMTSPGREQPKTSIIRTSADMPPADSVPPESFEDSADELQEGEYEIEGILAHHLSDPRTHPSEMGKDPVMLYKVKWKGWYEPTWEPRESFESEELIEEYHRALVALPGRA